VTCENNPDEQFGKFDGFNSKQHCRALQQAENRRASDTAIPPEGSVTEWDDVATRKPGEGLPSEFESDRDAYASASAEQAAGKAERPHDTDSWAPVDLAPYLRGERKRPEPSVGLMRVDGLRLLYPGKEHAVIGEMEAGKSWVSIVSAAAELNNDNHVLYIHFEEADPMDTVERLQALGVPDEKILTLFHFVGPERQVSADALAKLLDPAPTLVIFDGVNEAMSLNGWGIRDEDGAAAFRRYLVKPCTAVNAAVLSCDHVVKDPERRGRNALGSIHKGNGLTGALILLENTHPFGRGQRGRSRVYVTKDRPGYLRRHGMPDKVPGKTLMGTLTVDDTREFVSYLDLQFLAPSANAAAAKKDDEGNPDDAKVLAAIKAVSRRGKIANLRAVRAAVDGMRGAKIDETLARLDLAGVIVETSGPRGARVFTVAEDQLQEAA
jgi:hypothetical protein